MDLINVVAPIYNEEPIVEELVKQLKNNIEKVTKNFKIILIDDGSTDGSWDKIENLCASNSNIIGLKFSRNFGHHYAITAGIHESNSEWVIVMDSDLQDRPEVIPELFQKAQEGYDIVFVSRTNREDSLFYRIAQKLFYLILRTLSGIKFDSTQANFSIINRKVVEAFKKFPEQARFYGSTIIWLGFNRTSIKAKHGRRFKGKPSYSFKKRVKLASDIILAFSDRPLKFVVYFGVIMSFFSFIFISLIIFLNFQGQFIESGWPSLIASIYFVGGIQIFILGITGMYISKIFNQVKTRPLYIISKELNVYLDR